LAKGKTAIDGLSGSARAGARGVFLNARRHADAAWFGQGFQSSGDVHTVAEDVAVLDHDVTHVDANAEVDALVGRHSRIALAHTSLHLGRAAQGVDEAAELDEQTVTGRLDEPTVVRGDRRINQLDADRLQRFEGAALVRPDQA